MASLSSPARAELRSAVLPPAAHSPRRAQEVVLVAGFGDSVAKDYADHVGRSDGETACRLVNLLAPSSIAELHEAAAAGRVPELVAFLPPRLTEQSRQALGDLFTLAAGSQLECITLVGTANVHLGDRHAAEVESFALERARGLARRTTVFRAGHVLSSHSQAAAWLRRLGWCYPLVPRRLRGCCVGSEELFAAIERERRASGTRRPRLLTVLGPNLPWREWLARGHKRGLASACLTAVAWLLSLLFLGHLVALALAVLNRATLERWHFDTLRPESLRELLALCNPYNRRYVKVVGYNNGVVHFGHRYPGQTVVSTVGCNRVVRTGAGLLKADCGATVRKALDFLAAQGAELPVVPNYSYVCLGTAFFVPIHGSASDFSTIADTITRVLLYDPSSDRIIAADRDEPAFRDHVYNAESDVVVLRLYLRAKLKSRYFVHRQTLEAPAASELLDALGDTRAANVEIRKSQAGSAAVTVSRYYTDPQNTPGPVLEMPRDALGRLWDRLEENALTSFLMHAATRHFAWHVELFFTAAEFAVFWDTHAALPLRKLQLRYIRQDGLPHSAFRDHDCVSVDLFMLRRHRRRFEAYLKATYPVVRTNPGKHSR
jgi:hypothetical protein